MTETFLYLMECYFYQDWQSEFPQVENVLLYFASKDNSKILHNLIADIQYILKNNLSQKIFVDNDFDFDLLLEGYKSEKNGLKMLLSFYLKKTKSYEVFSQCML